MNYYENVKNIFENDYKGVSHFISNVLQPIFGDDCPTEFTTVDLLEDSNNKKKAEQANIKSAEFIGEIPTEYSGPINLYDITIKDNCTISQSRVGIQNIVRSNMMQFSYAFILFHYEKPTCQSWRFSFASKDANNTKSPNAKRFTYLFGEDVTCRTAAQRFNELRESEKKDEDLLDAFSVEKLSDEFFDKYLGFYASFVKYITGEPTSKEVGEHKITKTAFVDTIKLMDSIGKFDNLNQFEKVFRNDPKGVNDYVKKLLGRITFLHFLQKKGWLCNDNNYMFNLFFKECNCDQDDYLERILEPLFFGVLNIGLYEDTNKMTPDEIKEETYKSRRIFWEKHNKEAQTNNNLTEWDINLLDKWKDVPYLNGGLFEDDTLDRMRVRFPAKMFAALFDFFAQYNFTIDENDPNDAEVGVDPEMLGKIFENLLEDNKDKGAFYTPKEIVQYMCKESLVSYLCEKCGKENEKTLREFVKTPQYTDVSNIKGLFEAIKGVKICDPAIGSGAFPMELLNILYHCHLKLCDKSSPVEIKKHIIENNIYGVDIERGAVDIARLRFWLALVVDEIQPEPLPNLDYKIMQGNFLLESYEEIDLNNLTCMSTMQIYEPVRNLFGDILDKQIKVTFTNRNDFDLNEALDKFYNSNLKHTEKVELKEKIYEYVREQLLYNIDLRTEPHAKIIDRLSEQSVLTNIQAKKLNESKEKYARYIIIRKDIEQMPMQNDKFFLWHTWFSDVFNRPNGCNGFDIVIGNPPYIKEYISRHAFDGFKEFSKYYQGKMDLWYGFACESLDLLNDSGTLCFIATNNWGTNTGASNLRDKIISDTKIKQLIDFGSYMIFGDSASIQTMIMIFQKDSVTDNYTFDYRKLTRKNAKENDIIMLLNKTQEEATYVSPVINRTFRSRSLLTFANNVVDSLLQKIDANNSDNFTEEDIAQGIVFPQDFLNKKGNRILPDYNVGTGIFGLTNEELNKLNLSQHEKTLIRPYYTTEQIHRYYTEKKNSQWLIYTDSSFKRENSMDSYPSLKKHLDNFKKIFTSDNKPYGLHRARNERFFQGSKIISLRKCSEKPIFSYSDFNVYVTQTFFIIQTNRFNMKFLTGLLNSKLIEFWLRNKGKMQGDNFQVDKEPLMQIPIKTEKTAIQQIVSEVDKILTFKRTNINSDIHIEETNIDIIVYHLYGLTYDDVLIVDPNAPITREEYEKNKYL